jgi:multidrug efflux pump subunit AcrA (membrane-fusion protein)
MYAEVKLTLSERKAVLAVPITAVDSEGATGQVMVVTPNQRVEVRKIGLGLETADKVEVRSGLNEGDMVVIGGRSSLQPGEEVRPKVVTMSASKP